MDTTTLEELLKKDGKLVYKTRGVSMLPMLRQNRDLVVIEVPSGRLKQDDVALYRRGKDYVLHRVLEVKDGYYHIRGDNTDSVEHVQDTAVIGVLTAFVRDGKKILVTDRKYQMYVRVWRHTYGLRVFYLRCRRLGSRVKHKLLG